jgi:hypothetical protein
MPAPYSVFHRLVVSVSCSHMRCPVGAHRTPQSDPAERDRTGASTGSDQTHPLAHSAKAGPSPSFPAYIGPVPRSPQKSQRSGIGPKQALEAIKPIPSRTARKPILPRASLRAKVRSRGAPKNRSGAGSDRSKHWKRSSPSPRAQRESRSFPELPCERRFGPAEPPKIAAERDRSDACIGSDQTLPLAHSAKTNPPPSLPACIGPVPRSPPSNSARFTQAVPLIPSPA